MAANQGGEVVGASRTQTRPGGGARDFWIVALAATVSMLSLRTAAGSEQKHEGRSAALRPRIHTPQYRRSTDKAIRPA